MSKTNNPVSNISSTALSAYSKQIYGQERGRGERGDKEHVFGEDAEGNFNCTMIRGCRIDNQACFGKGKINTT